MRYKVTVRRVQVAERNVRATDEQAALDKIADELRQPYSFLGSWQTVDTDVDIDEVQNPLPYPPLQITSADGTLLLAIKEAAEHLGIPRSSLYGLVNSGEIAHVVIGSRRYVSREQLHAFIETHSHSGYVPTGR